MKNAVDEFGKNSCLTTTDFFHPFRTAFILVVGDNPFNQQLLLAIIKQNGWRGFAVRTGREALKILRSVRVGVILIDINAHSTDDIEPITKICEHNPGEKHIPIIVIGTDATSELRDRYITIGADYYTCKPLNATELRYIIGQSLMFDASRNKSVRPWHHSFAPPVDAAAVKELRQIRKGLVTDLLQQVCNNTATLKRVISLKDAGRVEFLAHKIKETISHIGALPARDIAARLEIMGRSGQLEGASDLWMSLSEEIVRVYVYLETLHKEASMPEWMGEKRETPRGESKREISVAERAG